jgi:hypothetical protein
MTKADEYRNKARDCLTLAGAVRDPLEWTELQHIASAYLRLAERTEAWDHQDQFHASQPA